MTIMDATNKATQAIIPTNVSHSYQTTAPPFQPIHTMVTSGKPDEKEENEAGKQQNIVPVPLSSANPIHRTIKVSAQMAHLIAGGVAAAITRCCCQPLDVLKIRFQLQVEPIKARIGHKSKYSSLTQAARMIYIEEGGFAFWKGHNPAQVLSIIYGVSQFWAFEQTKAKAKEWNLYQEHAHTTNFICGSIAGTFGAILTNPLDVIRTRLIAQDHCTGYRNTAHAFGWIWRKEGIRGLYRGLGPAILQIAPVTGANFMFYKFLNSITVQWHHLEHKSDVPAIISFTNGAMAGLAAKTLFYPLDLTKKRMQIQGFGEHRTKFGKHFECTGIAHCLRETVINEGVLGLYKGMKPSILKAGLVSALSFCIYDNILFLLK